MKTQNFVQKLLRISRWQQHTMKPKAGPFWEWDLCAGMGHTLVKLSLPKSLEVFNKCEVLLKLPTLNWTFNFSESFHREMVFPVETKPSESGTTAGKPQDVSWPKFLHIQNRGWLREVVFKLCFQTMPWRTLGVPSSTERASKEWASQVGHS